VNINLTDRQRVQLAQREYWDWQSGQEVRMPDQTVIGQVERVANTADGFRATVIKHSSQEKIILLRGSSGIRHGDPTTWTNEWLRVNLPIGDAILHQLPDIPAEMWTAANWLNQLMANNPTITFYIYGHSLGSINGQFALANCRYPDQVAGAWLYEGPNLYWLLNPRQRKNALNLRCRIFNYIDPRDVVALGYLDAQHTIGLLRVVQSILLSPITQHMWGGYQFDRTGQLLLADTAELHYRALLDRYLIEWVQRQSH
jgi:pimeloyl-ACP methyl ester carboxylesterase